MGDMVVPLSMALITVYDAGYLGVGDGDDAPEAAAAGDEG
jgi:hypothetical protein